jgi:hypothetical protein
MPRTVILNSLKAITTKPEINPCIFFTPAWQFQATDFLDFPRCNPKFLAEMEFLPFSHYFFHGLLGVAWTRKEHCLCPKSAWSYATHFQHRCWEPWAANSECISPCPLRRKKFFGRCVLDASVFWDAKQERNLGPKWEGMRLCLYVETYSQGSSPTRRRSFSLSTKTSFQPCFCSNWPSKLNMCASSHHSSS